MSSSRRHVTKAFPTEIIGDEIFEIDENGHPYWVVHILKANVGIGGLRDTKEVIIVDAVSGEIETYSTDDVPAWVDTVYTTRQMTTQTRERYKYNGGFFNSIFAKKNTMNVSTNPGDYNYISINDEIHVFTGIRPATSSKGSNTGVVYISQRTGKAIALDLPGASMSAAEETATGEIAEKGYTPSTPMIISINNNPVYVMSLKDSSGVVRGFSLVNYKDYTVSATGNTLEETVNKYTSLTGGKQEESVPTETENVNGVIAAVESYVLEGNTIYLFTLEGSEEIYEVLNVEKHVPFLRAGNEVELTVDSGNTTRVLEITKK